MWIAVQLTTNHWTAQHSAVPIQSLRDTTAQTETTPNPSDECTRVGGKWVNDATRAAHVAAAEQSDTARGRSAQLNIVLSLSDLIQSKYRN